MSKPLKIVVIVLALAIVLVARPSCPEFWELDAQNSRRLSYPLVFPDSGTRNAGSEPRVAASAPVG